MEKNCKIIDYQIVSDNNVKKMLALGYVLHGPAFYNNKDDIILQPMVLYSWAEKKYNVHLTYKESMCLQWSIQGKTAEEISLILGCKHNTVRNHLANLRRKFRVNTIRQVIARGISEGYIVDGKVVISQG